MTEDGTQSSAIALASNVFLDLDEDGREEILQYCILSYIVIRKDKEPLGYIFAVLFHSPLLVAEMPLFSNTSR